MVTYWFWFVIGFITFNGCAYFRPQPTPYESALTNIDYDYMTHVITHDQYASAIQNLNIQKQAEDQQRQQLVALYFQNMGYAVQQAQYNQNIYDQQRFQALRDSIHHDRSTTNCTAYGNYLNCNTISH